MPSPQQRLKVLALVQNYSTDLNVLSLCIRNGHKSLLQHTVLQMVGIFFFFFSFPSCDS